MRFEETTPAVVQRAVGARQWYSVQRHIVESRQMSGNDRERLAITWRA